MDGKWWGSNPVIKAQDDVDLLAIDRSGRKAIFVESDTPTAKARWVLIYVNFQIYSKVYKTSLFL